MPITDISDTVLAGGAELPLVKKSEIRRHFPEILTLPELADYIRVSKSSLYHYSRDGKIPARKIGRHWRYHKSAIDAWVKNEKPSTFRGAKRKRR